MSEAATCTRVSIDKLIVDRSYQRPVEERRVTRIVDEFDAKLLGTLELSERTNGSFAVIDGQHRFEALKVVGRKTAPALVHRGLTRKQEADLFARTNMGRKPLTPIQRFRAQVFAGDPRAVDLQKIITTAGYKVDYSSNATELGAIRSIVALENAYDTYGREHIVQLLESIRDMWWGEQVATDQLILRGMSTFLSIYGENFTDEHRERVGRHPAQAILRRAQEKALTGKRRAIVTFIADDIRKIAGLRTSKPKGVKQVSSDERHERHLQAV